MTGQVPDQNGVPEADITFRDRQIRVKCPTPEQILVWRRIMSRLESSNVKDWNSKEVLDALERIMKIIESVLVNQSDKTWIEDRMLETELTITDASDILLKALKAFQNRGQRRSVKPATPARRKAAVKTTPSKTAPKDES